MSFNIFISYSTKDVEIIKPLVKQLSLLEEIKIFFADKTINPGDKISQVIINHIRSADLFIVFHSEFAKDSNYVQQEIGAAVASEKIIIPVLLDSTKPTGMLADRNYLNLCKPEKQEHELKRLHNFLIGKVQSKKESETLWLVVGALATLGLVLGLCSYLDSRDRKKRKTEKKEKQEPIIETESQIYDAVYEVTPEVEFKETEIGKIPIDWDIEKLKNLCNKIGSGATPKGGSEVYIFSGTAFIRSQNVYDVGFKAEGLVYIDDKSANKLANVELKENDVLLNITGDSICRCCIVPENILPGRVNQHVSILRVNEKLYHKFLFCYLCLKQTKSRLLSYDAGGTRKAITKGMLEDFPVPLPDYDEQVRIGDFFWEIHEKIETNRQINQVLEKIGHKLFKQWFVDFEFPDEEGNPYKSNGGEFDSELGIPKGWDVKPFSEVIGVNPTRKITKRSEARKVSMSDLNPWESGIGSWSVEEYKSGPKFSNGDVLFARITPCLENGKTAFVSFLDENEVAFGSTEFIVLSPKAIKSSAYIFFLSRDNSLREKAILSMTGSSGRQRVPNDFFDNFLITVPPDDIVEKFDEFGSEIMEKIKNNFSETRRLSQLRDKLLPKIMSGEIRV